MSKNSELGTRNSKLSYDAVLLISFGGPEMPEDVMPFLEIVTRGRGIPKERLIEVAHHYEAIGGASPINAITRQQAKAVENQLKAEGLELKVYIGQRNWHPFLEETLREMAKDGVKRAVGFPTAPHRSEASLERYVNALEEARGRIGDAAPVIDYVGPWFDHPLFIEAIFERVKEVLPSPPAPSPSAMARGPQHKGEEPSPYSRERAAKPGEGVPLIFTAHSIPCTMAKESTYVEELRRTAAGVASRLGKKEWSLAYSSRSGNPREPWLEPDICDAIRKEATLGTKDLLIVPIGFIADHVEILFDLDVEAKEAADKAGVRLYRASSVGDHVLFIRMVADVIRKRMAASELPEQRSSGSTLYTDGTRENAVGKNAAVCFCQPGSQDTPCRRWAQEHP